MTEQTDHHPPHPPTLDAVLEEAWRLLVRGVADRKHAFHQPVLATIDEHALPCARTVVLRRVVPEDRLVICHTDRRSPKVAQLERTPIASWAFYDPRSRVQIRIRGRTRIELPGESSVAEEAWAATRLMSRRCYLAPSGPSTPTETPSINLPDDLATASPDEGRSEAGRANFAALVTRVDRLDWLRLRHDGHRRALFEWADRAAEPRATWLEP